MCCNYIGDRRKHINVKGRSCTHPDLKKGMKGMTCSIDNCPRLK